MNDVLRDLLNVCVIVYLDDILIYSRDLPTHRQHVRQVLQILREHSLYTKLEKFSFEKTSLLFLGYIVSADGFQMDPEKVAAIRNWPQPRGLKALQRFLGFANFYRHFIPGYSRIVAPLTALTQKGANVVDWPAQACQAFEDLKRAFLQDTCLHHPDPSRPFVVEVDASNVAVGAVLSQHSDTGQLLPCSFYSRRFSPAESNYGVGDKELLAAPASTCSESCGPGFRKAILEGQPACCFDCIPCSKEEFSNQTDAKECMKCPKDQWPTKRQDGCQKKTIEFLSYLEPLGMVLAVISVLGALMSAAILVIFIQNRNTPVVKANNRELSYLLLLALILSFGCSLIFIGHPTTLTCMVQQMTFGIVFAICISCLLAKTIMVVIAFKATKPTSNLKLLVGPRVSNALVLACSLIQVIICVSWLIKAPPFYQMNMKSQMGKIILECNEGSLFAFYYMLGYMGFLATISFIVAFLARRLPDSFNEAKFITFSMITFIAVWLSFIPAYLSTTGKYTVAVEIFAILTSSVGLLGCIFFPKCYIILFRPDMNTKEFLMGKATGSLTKTN
ncbi:vomeronasal type-2 receptor 26-like [Rhinatrema bivittatum]|uniref:vomeronasal type-2 receptor 26-like n=1 Tax=Rhinatrema bivittatum TaxID=194408 RepID=UPI00112B8F51|nr:vomeronasal type-2 receptor 26-like [Rhinatrema bivittatum]